ncbi:hypothetical protein CR513_48422, partial [Mucuna pruriens]
MVAKLIETRRLVIPLSFCIVYGKTRSDDNNKGGENGEKEMYLKEVFSFLIFLETMSFFLLRLNQPKLASLHKTSIIFVLHQVKGNLLGKIALGRLMLANMVISSMPTYNIHITWLPQYTCDNIDNLLEDLYGRVQMINGLIWLDGKNITKARKHDGLGLQFVRLLDFVRKRTWMSVVGLDLYLLGLLPIRLGSGFLLVVQCSLDSIWVDRFGLDRPCILELASPLFLPLESNSVLSTFWNLIPKLGSTFINVATIVLLMSAIGNSTSWEVLGTSSILQ